MKISPAAIHRPVFVTMVVLIVMILGGIAFIRLPIDLMPDITYPTISITTEYEDASPEEIEELVTRPIEEAMSAVPGVQDVNSISLTGRSNIRVTFNWGTDLDAAANDIRDRLDRVVGRLPDGIEKPFLRKFDLASFPVLILGAASNLDPVQMRQLIDDQVKYRVERVPGVASLDVWGGLEREIHVNLDAHKIKALGLSLTDILARVNEGNVVLPAGTIERGNLDVMIRTPGTYKNLDDLRRMAVAVREGVPIELGEIARVADAWQKVTRSVRVNGKPGIRLSINKQSGTNTVDVARGVLRELEDINRDLPQLNITPIIDTSNYIKRSITNVGTSALYGSGLSLIVLLLFLRDVRSTAVIATAIPISIIATFVLIYFSGFTLNIMTLGGLALGVGMLVDNAIVVLENISRLRDEGESPFPAAIKGSGEVTAAMVASTLTTLAVFLPLVFMRGMSGVMFKQLAYVVSFALLCSLGVALTFVPMLSARVLKTHGAARNGGSIGERIFQISGTYFDRLEKGYRELLAFALSHRALVLVSAVLLLIGSLALIPLVGVAFMPDTDEGEVRVNVEMEVGTRLELIDRKIRGIERIVQEAVPETRSWITFVGGIGFRASGTHTAEMRIGLKPASERKRTSEQIAAALRPALAHIPGVKVRTRAGQGLYILRMGASDADKIQVEIRGYDMETADLLSRQIRSLVEQVPGVTDVNVSREAGSPEEHIIVDRQRAADMKVSVSQVANTLKTALSGTQAGNFKEAGDEYKIMVRMENPEKMSLAEILDLTVSNSDGRPVAMRNLVRATSGTGAVSIERKNQERLVTVSANFFGRDMGSILSDIRERLDTLPVPRDFSIGFGGDYEEQQKSFRELLLSFVLALTLVYMVMACQYESLRDPFVVMFSVPFAVIGVVLMLFLTNTTFNVQSFIGCIMLAGIVVNNAILLVDHTNLLRRRDGMPLREAIMEAGRRRLRPIMMTAMTTMLALVPLAVGMGEGGEAQAPMARAVIGGLLSSNLITLLIVPIVYDIFEKRFGKKELVAESGGYDLGKSIGVSE